MSSAIFARRKEPGAGHLSGATGGASAKRLVGRFSDFRPSLRPCCFGDVLVWQHRTWRRPRAARPAPSPRSRHAWRAAPPSCACMDVAAAGDYLRVRRALLGHEEVAEGLRLAAGLRREPVA